jgi:hypothetical protein
MRFVRARDCPQQPKACACAQNCPLNLVQALPAVAPTASCHLCNRASKSSSALAYCHPVAFLFGAANVRGSHPEAMFLRSCEQELQHTSVMLSGIVASACSAASLVVPVCSESISRPSRCVAAHFLRSLAARHAQRHCCLSFGFWRKVLAIDALIPLTRHPTRCIALQWLCVLPRYFS